MTLSHWRLLAIVLAVVVFFLARKQCPQATSVTSTFTPDMSSVS